MQLLRSALHICSEIKVILSFIAFLLGNYKPDMSSTEMLQFAYNLWDGRKCKIARTGLCIYFYSGFDLFGGELCNLA